MHRLATLAFGIILSGFLVATAEAQSPAVQSSPAQNPPSNTNAAPDSSIQRDLKLEVPDGFGGMKYLPDAGADPTAADPDSTTGVSITPTDPQILLPNDNDPGPER